MKKLICFIGTAVVLAGFSARAATLNEWNFYSDPVGTSLSQAYNANSGAAFTPVPGYDDSALRTDGAGALVCTHLDSGTSGMWTNGAKLAAAVPPVSAGIQYLRYDFSYDLSSTNNNSGCVVGFAFNDSTSNKIAGIALQYDVGASNTVPYTVTQVTEITNTSGSVAVVARLDLNAKTLAVWYNLYGNVGGFVSNAPMTTVSNLTLTSFDSLGFQATGDVQPAGSADQVEIELLRSADSWADILASAPAVPAPKYANEWNFERDVDGRTLSQTINSGTNSPLAQFSAGGTNCFVTNHTLRCTGEDSGSTGAWTNGAVLDAALPSSTSGVHYLRYDVDYDFSSSSNNSGTMLGVYFTGDAGNKAAGLVLGYDKGDLTNQAATAGRTLTAVTNVALSGTLTAIAEINLNTNPATLKVWYGLNGSSPTNYSPEAFSTNVTLTAITNLRFHATGDFQPAGSTDYADVDNIRHTMGATAGGTAWSEITAPAADLSAPPASPVLSISVTNDLNGSMLLGETNRVSVVISNAAGAGAAPAVTSVLTNSGSASAFTITSNNAPVSLAAGESVTNTYEMVAVERGTYTIFVNASSGTNSVATNFALSAGANLSFLPEKIVGLSEPGETLNITITTTNDGVRAVSNIVNSLTSASAGFTVAPSTANYSALAIGSSTSTVYTVGIGAAVPAGTYTFYVTNSAGGLVWTNSFTISVVFEADPSVSTTNLTINVASGETTNTTLLLSNSGNKSVKFTISTDGRLPLGSYTASTQDLQIVGIPARDVPYFIWTENSSASTNIGFAFHFNGELYTNFSVSAYGAITFGGETAGANPGGTTLIGGSSVVSPFWSGSAVNTDTIRYISEPTRLVISWGSGTGNEFQAWLHKNGQIDYIYEAGTWGSAAIGVQTVDAAQNIGYTPGESFQSLHLTPKSWVTYAPTNGTVAGRGSNTVTFTANASEKGAQTNVFNAYVTWDNGTTSTVAVTVRVLNSIYGLTIAPTNVVTFSGAAGITKTNIVSLINTGNVALAYTVTDLSAQTNGYAWTNTSFLKEAFSLSGSKSLYGMDENNSGWLALGFPFSFYGNVYTQLFVNVNGSIELGSSTQTNLDSSRIIAPYVGNLYLDSNAKVFYSGDANQMVITWQNIAQTGGGNDLTFQTVLNRNGNILFQYQQLNDTNAWPDTFIGVKDTTSGSQTSASLANSQTTTITTNYSTTTTNYTTVTTNGSVVTTNVWDATITVTNGTNIVVTYNPVTEQAILITPSTRIGIITASPLSGTIPAGGTNVLTLIGDARSLLFTTNLPNYAVTNRTTFNISYMNSSKTLSATFIATNSTTAAYASAEALADMWGADPVFTSQQNTDGSYALSWTQADDGIGRTYRVWYKTSLSNPEWTKLDPPVVNGTSFVVGATSVPVTAPAVFFKVTVE